jgi:hypothetical protein
MIITITRAEFAHLRYGGLADGLARHRGQPRQNEKEMAMSRPTAMNCRRRRTRPYNYGGRC